MSNYLTLPGYSNPGVAGCGCGINGMGAYSRDEAKSLAIMTAAGLVLYFMLRPR